MLESLNLENISGDVKLTVSADGKTYVSATKVEFEQNGNLEVERSGKDLVVKVESDGLFSNDNCKAHFEIKFPKEIALNMKSDSGDFNINGTSGKIDFELGSGDVIVNAEGGKIDGKSGSGSIKISGTFNETKIKTGSGTIDISGLPGNTSDKDFLFIDLFVSAASQARSSSSKSFKS